MANILKKFLLLSFLIPFAGCNSHLEAIEVFHQTAEEFYQAVLRQDFDAEVITRSQLKPTLLQVQQTYGNLEYYEFVYRIMILEEKFIICKLEYKTMYNGKPAREMLHLIKYYGSESQVYFFFREFRVLTPIKTTSS